MRWRTWKGAACLSALLAFAVLPLSLEARESDRLAIPAAVKRKVDLQFEKADLAGDRLRLELTRKKGSLRGCVALTAGAGGWEEARVDWTSARPDAKAVLELRPNQMVLFRPNVAEKQTLEKGGVEVPGGLFLNEKKPGSTKTVLRTFKLHLRPAVSPLPWVEDGAAFEADLFVGIKEVNPKAGNSDPLSWEHPITVILTGTTARAEPNSIGITRTGTRGYRKVRLRCAKSDPMPSIEGDSPVGMVALEVPVAVLLHRIDLTATKTRIWGYGLEATTLGVELFSQDGLPWAPPENLDVALSTNRGNIPSKIEVPAGENRGEGEVRSGETGAAEVTARAMGRLSEPLTLEFTTPTSVFIWALVAALFGSAARMFVDAKKRPADAPKPSIARQFGRVVIGVAGGFLFTAVVLLGIREGVLPALARATELGCAVVAFVGGYLGAVVLDQISKKMFGLEGDDGS